LWGRIAKGKEAGMERKQTFLRFEIEALRELQGKLSWKHWVWLLIDLLVVTLIVFSCNG